MFKPKTEAERRTREWTLVHHLTRQLRDKLEARLLGQGLKGKYVCFALHNTDEVDDHVIGNTPEEVLEKARAEYGDDRPYSGFRVTAERSDISLSSLGDSWW